MKSLASLRTRWAAIGAAIAVTLGGGAFGVVRATVSSGDRAAYFPITPTRVLDTRDSSAVSNGTLKLTVEGPINVVGEGSARAVVPTDASSVAINLTVTGGRKNGGYGFVTAYPCTSVADPAPNASSLNFEDGVDIANALNVTTSTDGSICLYVYGTADLIIDIAGYYADHNHDDRYLQTTALVPHPGPSGPTFTDATPGTGEHPSMIMLMRGTPAVTYYSRSGGDLKYLACIDPECLLTSSISIDSLTANVGEFSASTVRPDGIPVIAYFATTGADLKFASCNDYLCAGPTITSIDTGGDVGKFVSIATLQTGNPVIAYHDATNTSLKIAVCANPACTSSTIRTLDNTGNTGYLTAIAVGQSGNPIITYGEIGTSPNQRVKVAACQDPSCTTVVINTISDAGSPIYAVTSDIAIGLDGLPIMVTVDSDANAMVIVRCFDVDCNQYAITEAATEGIYPSIAIMASGLPVFTFQGTFGITRNLRMSTCATPDCGLVMTATVDNSPGAGAYSSLVIGPDQVPMIAHYDETNTNLKVTRVPVVMVPSPWM